MSHKKGGATKKRTARPGRAATSGGGRNRSRKAESRGRGSRRSPLLRIDILTLFPGIFESPFEHSLLAKARAKGLLDLRVHDIRDEAQGRHRSADDAPYGGGDGMVMMPGPVVRSIERVVGKRGWVVLLSPAGALLTQSRVRVLSARKHLVIVCGRYGGVDERVGSLCVDEEISIGDYVLGGGEPAAITLVDAVARLVPGVVGNEDSTVADSFTDGLLEYPQFTRPVEFRGLKVPDVLRSGDHARVKRWRRKEALRRTLSRRPDLLSDAELSTQDHLLLTEIRQEESSKGEPQHPGVDSGKGRKTGTARSRRAE